MSQYILEKDITIPADKKKYDVSPKEEEIIAKKFNICILKNIGYGGFGIVKLVKHNLDNKYYALKLVSAHCAFLYNILYR